MGRIPVPKTTDRVPELYPYQQAGVEFLRNNDRAYLGDEMGLGKTVQLIRGSVGRTLVVAPAMLVDSGTWQREIDLWADDPSRFTVTAYTRLPGRDGRKMSRKPREEFDQEWDTLIFDEAHYLKNRDSIRTVVSLRIARRAKRVYLASGTPVPNWAHELFVPLQILNPEGAKTGMAYGSYWRWVETWFRVSASPFARGALDIGRLKGCSVACSRRSPDDPCEHYQAFSRANLGDRMLRRLRDDVLQDLPDLRVQRVPVPMTTKQWAEYRRMREEYIATVDDSERVAWSGASRHVYLDQITTSLGMLSGDPTAHSGKFEMLAEDLAQRSRPTVVVAHYRATVEGAAQVARDLEKSVGVIHGQTPQADRHRIVEEFQAGKLDVLVGSFDTISEGLTLTAADTLIMLELSYKAARNQQAIRRIHRIGQDQGCLVLEYYSTGPKGQPTLDSAKRDLVDRKIQGAAHALTAATIKELL